MNRQTLLEALKRLVYPVYRLPSILRASHYLRGSRLGRRVRLINRGSLRVQGAVNLAIEDGVFFNGGPFRTELLCGPDGEISIGLDTGFNYGVSLQARDSIRIGRDCRFGAMVMVRDHDGLRVAPVVIGDRVWLAHCAIIEPGVSIGDDSVVSAGSVVVEDVPPGMIAIGNPARCLPLRTLRRPSERQGTAHGAASP